MAPLVYLRRELKFTAAEWMALPDKDKNDLREYAVEEMGVLGIKVK